MNYHRLNKKMILADLNDSHFQKIADFIDTFNKKQPDHTFSQLVLNDPIIPNNFDCNTILNQSGPEGCYVLANKLLEIANQLKHIADDDMNTAIQQATDLNDTDTITAINITNNY